MNKFHFILGTARTINWNPWIFGFRAFLFLFFFFSSAFRPRFDLHSANGCDILHWHTTKQYTPFTTIYSWGWCGWVTPLSRFCIIHIYHTANDGAAVRDFIPSFACFANQRNESQIETVDHTQKSNFHERMNDVCSCSFQFCFCSILCERFLCERLIFGGTLSLSLPMCAL